MPCRSPVLLQVCYKTAANGRCLLLFILSFWRGSHRQTANGRALKSAGGLVEQTLQTGSGVFLWWALLYSFSQQGKCLLFMLTRILWVVLFSECRCLCAMWSIFLRIVSLFGTCIVVPSGSLIVVVQMKTDIRVFVLNGLIGSIQPRVSSGVKSSVGFSNCRYGCCFSCFLGNFCD